MSTGMIILMIAGLLLLFGVGQRVLDRLRLTDKQALLFIALIIGCGFLPEISLGNQFSFNIGGFLIPLGLCVYLWIKADSAWERVRSLIASVLAGAAAFLIGRYAPNEPESIVIDPNYLYGLAAGVVAYVFGRSRRGAFIAGTLGMILAGVANAVLVWSAGIEQPLVLGGAGAYDAIVISGFVAVLLAELVGEIIERMDRGNKKPDKEFSGGDFVDKEGSK